MDIAVNSAVKEAHRRMGRKAICYGYSMAYEAVAMRLADKMMFAGTRPWNARPKTHFARACYKL